MYIQEVNCNLTETYVSIETGKALKQLGYYRNGLNTFNSDNCFEKCLLYLNGDTHTNEQIKEYYFNAEYVTLKPTLDLAIEWVRVNLNIWIQVNLNEKMDRYSIHIFTTIPVKYIASLDNRSEDHPEFGWETPNEAKEAALKYVLTNLSTTYLRHHFND